MQLTQPSERHPNLPPILVDLCFNGCGKMLSCAPGGRADLFKQSRFRDVLSRLQYGDRIFHLLENDRGFFGKVRRVDLELLVRRTHEPLTSASRRDGRILRARVRLEHPLDLYNRQPPVRLDGLNHLLDLVDVGIRKRQQDRGFDCCRNEP